jgi:hypothetical protein
MEKIENAKEKYTLCLLPVRESKERRRGSILHYFSSFSSSLFEASLFDVFLFCLSLLLYLFVYVFPFSFSLLLFFLFHLSKSPSF